MTSICPNKQPTHSTTYKLAVIGEAPGADEIARREPFIGASGRFLRQLLARAGVSIEATFFGNICQARPPANEIKFFEWNSANIQVGIEQLKDDLHTFDPNVTLLLGNVALKAAMDPDTVHPLLPGRYKHSVSDWRGSMFVCSHTSSPFFGRKCLASYHPAAILRNYEWAPILQFDIKKALSHAYSPILTLPERSLDVSTNVAHMLANLADIRDRKPKIAIDIEGYVDAMTCISIAESSTKAFIVSFNNSLSDWEEALLWRALALVLTDPLIPKILQNSLYDRFVLQYSYGIVVRGVVDDTMLKHWELYCELEKSLAFQCSLYTEQPYYKFQRKISDQSIHYSYCCTDSCVTHEISGVLDSALSRLEPGSAAHYRLNMALLNPLLYMELKGIRYDVPRAIERQHKVEQEVYALQYEIDQTCNCGIPTDWTPEETISVVRYVMCYVRDQNTPTKDYITLLPRALDLASRPHDTRTPAEDGELATLLDRHMNIKSQAFKKLLYVTLKLPPQLHRTTKKQTSDYAALLTLSKRTTTPIVSLAMRQSVLRTHAQMLSIHADSDGRIRCGYNVVGSETGRITCYTSPTGSGYNLQTIPNADRDLFLADAGYHFFQCDLSGADGWTVGAHLATLGDSTMLDDLKNGIKPAAAICYMLRHGNSSLVGKGRDEVRALLKEVKKEDWDYFACKKGIWGTCYLMGSNLLSNIIFVDSDGKINFTRSEINDFQQAVFSRYKPQLWHDFTRRCLARRPILTSASGQRRQFFGRREDILGEALANEPQQNTTYATNLAILNLWKDPENRVGNALIIQPLHQVHDAICGQFPIDRTDWAINKIRQYFNNVLTIAGQSITIPFEGGYGPNWRDTNVGKI